MTPYYDEDGITIYHGDCADVLPLIDPSTVALVLTDPPYGIGHDTDYASRLPDAYDWAAPIHGDLVPFDPVPLLAYGRCVLWGGNNFAKDLPSGGWIVWWKGFESDRDVRSECELAWTNCTRRIRYIHHRWIGASRETERGLRLHPTQKPTSLMKWVLERWTEPGDLIFDPYMGSGPVAQACHEMGRRYIGVEIVEEYCKVAVNRLAQGVFAL